MGKSFGSKNNMDNLWAPWRAPYISTLHQKSKDCLFCRIIQEEKDKKNYIFIRTEYSYSVLNIYPYNNGHVLVVPYRHVNDLSKLRKEEKADLFDLLESTKMLLDKVLTPGGYNIGMNIGRTAGAGFPGHLHIHVVPRWPGDVNFMPVVGNTKVISQSLKVLFERLSKASNDKK